MKIILSMAVSVVLVLSSNAMAAESVAQNEVPFAVQMVANKITEHFCPAKTRAYDLKQIPMAGENRLFDDTKSVWRVTMSSDKKMSGDCGIAIINFNGIAADPIAYEKAIILKKS